MRSQINPNVPNLGRSALGKSQQMLCVFPARQAGNATGIPSPERGRTGGGGTLNTHNG